MNGRCTGCFLFVSGLVSSTSFQGGTPQFQINFKFFPPKYFFQYIVVFGQAYTLHLFKKSQAESEK